SAPTAGFGGFGAVALTRSEMRLGHVGLGSNIAGVPVLVGFAAGGVRVAPAIVGGAAGAVAGAVDGAEFAAVEGAHGGVFAVHVHRGLAPGRGRHELHHVEAFAFLAFALVLRLGEIGTDLVEHDEGDPGGLDP